MIKFKHKQEYRKFLVTVMKQMLITTVQPVNNIYGSRYTNAHVTDRTNASLIHELPTFTYVEIKLGPNETADLETIRNHMKIIDDSKFMIVSWSEIT